MALQLPISPKFSLRHSSDDELFVTSWRSFACVVVKHLGCQRLSYLRQHWRGGTNVDSKLKIRFASGVFLESRLLSTAGAS